MKQIPEESINFSRMSWEEFGLYLRGLDSFQKCRGTLRKQTEESLLANILASTSSPTAALKALDGRSASLRVMLNIAAKLKREDEIEKLEELFRYLAIPGLLLPGEKTVSKTLVPVTVFMLDPDRTMLAIKWSLIASEVELFRYLFLGEAECELTPRMFELFPSLRGNNVGEYPELPMIVNFAGSHFGHAYCKEVLEKFSTDFHADGALSATGGENKIRLPADFPLANQYQLWFYGKKLAGERRIIQECLTQTSDKLLERGSVDPHYAFVLRGTKKDVLKQFGRQVQPLLGIWEFHLPSSFAHYSHNYLVGFHPQSEHRQWSKEWPLFASRNVSSGYGALLMVDPHKGVIDRYECNTYSEQGMIVPDRIVLNGTYRDVFINDDEAECDENEYRSGGSRPPIERVTHAEEIAQSLEAAKQRRKAYAERGEREPSLLDFDFEEMWKRSNSFHRDSIEEQLRVILATAKERQSLFEEPKMLPDVGLPEN